MNEIEITIEDVVRSSLNSLAKLRKELRDLQEKHGETVASATPIEVIEKFTMIDADFKPEFDRLNDLINSTETIIKDGVVQNGLTIKGDFLMGVFNKGRISWDSKALDGYAKGHPELLEFRKEGNPFASIRGI